MTGKELIYYEKLRILVEKKLNFKVNTYALETNNLDVRAAEKKMITRTGWQKMEKNLI
jgi:hypothetical protein